MNGSIHEYPTWIEKSSDLKRVPIGSGTNVQDPLEDKKGDLCILRHPKPTRIRGYFSSLKIPHT